MRPRVTALRPERRGHVAVDLDGERWRTVPAEVAATAGLVVGRELDRPALRELRRALRRSEALASATKALRHRDVSSARLTQRLEAAAVAPAVRADALEVLARAGLVDDERFAERRSEALAERGFGDEAILHDLERQGVPAELREQAVATLADETVRARGIVARRGAGPRTARYLAAKGFGEDALEAALDGSVADDT
ncbi:MAG: RecX family [Gaiellaceae bacterium]|nr:RecX family [Gaiellaceae bacterium]